MNTKESPIPAATEYRATIRTQGQYTPPCRQMSTAESFHNTIKDAGLNPPSNIEPGRFVRFPGRDKGNGNTAGWAHMFPDEQGGTYGDWSTGMNNIWHANHEPMSQAETEAFKRQVAESRERAARERQADQDKARQKAANIWDTAKPAPQDHPYLATKKVKPHGLKITNAGLIVPLRDSQEIVQSLQFIADDGSKRFLSGGAIKGHYYSIGEPDKAVLICEGYATGASLHEATGHAVAVAFNAGNLLPVARKIREKFPDIQIIIASDNDRETEGNPGVSKATEAARAIGALLAIPQFKDLSAKPTDFNDLAALEGLEIVREQVEAVGLPADKKSEWPEPIPFPSVGGAGTEQEYPFELLPSPIFEAAGEAARFSKVPEVSTAIVGLACCATAISKKAVVVERPGLKHHPALFFSLLAASGERKTPAFKNMSVPLEKWAADQKEPCKALTVEVNAKNAVIDSALSGLKGQAKKEGVSIDFITEKMKSLEAQRLEQPPLPILFTTDTTEERLFQKMFDRGGAFAVMSGEGRQVFDAIMGKYSGDGRTGDAIYLAGISGDTITRDRVGGDRGPEEKFIPTPCLNVCVMVQPDKYMDAAANPALRESGALARISPVWLPSLVSTRIEEKGEPGLDLKRMAGYNTLVRNLIDAKLPEDVEYHEAHLSEEAAESRRQYHNHVERTMADGEDFEDVRDIASKAVTQAVKIALILHLADDPSLLGRKHSFISNETWVKAQAMGTYHLLESVRVQRMASDYDFIQKINRILNWIRRKELSKVSVRDLLQFGPRPRPKSAEKAMQLLEKLTEHDYLRREQRGDRKKPVYVVNPKIFNNQNK